MIYVSTCIGVIVYILWNYIFFKTYQLCGYKVKNFCKSLFNFNLAFGDKNKLNFTKRMMRFLILIVLISYGLFFVVNRFTPTPLLLLLNYIVLFFFSPVVLIIAHFIILPLEEIIKRIYILKAKKKLSHKKIIKIGITGSFGKTSTKNILTTLLEKEYKVCSSPQNYNTEMGITKTILSSLDDHDIFIAEMGARHCKDIKKLADIVRPDYGIITTIGKAHIESFKSLENIENTKFELANGLAKHGTMIFNGDSRSTLKLFEKFDGKKYLTATEKGFSYAKNIVIDDSGSRFDLVIDGQELSCQTKLLGRININNIVTASTCAYLIGISKEDIVSGIKQLQPSSHRLELIKNQNSIIIDDSYNSNLVGAQEALEVMSKFPGKKIVVTPGIVELGNEQSQVNFTLGAIIADEADYIIIMNDENKNYLLSGAISHNFDRQKIYFCSSRKRQKQLLSLLSQSGSVILFENDLPDNFK